MDDEHTMLNSRDCRPARIGAVAWIALLVSCTCFGAPFVPARDAHCVAFSADGSLVATGISGLSNEEFPPRPHPNPRKCGVVQVWDFESGKRLHRFETFGDLTHVAFSSDSAFVAVSRLFSTHDRLRLHEVRVWSVDTGREALVFDRCHAFDFAPQGQAIAVASRRRCVVYDLTTEAKLKQFPGLAGSLSLRYSPDGRTLLGIVTSNEGVKLRASVVANPLDQISSEASAAPFYSSVFAPDGMTVATGHIGNVMLWDAASLTPLRRLALSRGGMQHPFYSPDGSILGAGNQNNGDVVFWDLLQDRQLARYTFAKGSFHTYHARRPDERIVPETDPARFVFSPDGHSFLAAPHGGILRSVTTGQDTRRFGD